MADLRERFLGERVMAACIEAMPELVLVLNHQRQVVAVNEHLLRALDIDDPATLVGSRPGEVLHCLHAHEGQDGCGTGPHCQVCGAALAIDACRRQAARKVQECLMTIKDARGDRALELEVVAAPFTIEGIPLILCAMRDIGDRKRREALELLFFHDVMNTAECLMFLSELMQRQGAGPERIEQLSRTVWRLIDEVRAQRTLAMAERGELVPQPTAIDVAALLREVAETHASQAAARGTRIEVSPCSALPLRSDPVLVRRILVNLVKNAVEATSDGVVILAAAAAEGGVRFAVRNPGVMSDEVREQMFHRSFSTKGAGRGLGTYCRLFVNTDSYGGRLTVHSAAPDGTEVAFWLPADHAGDPPRP